MYINMTNTDHILLKVRHDARDNTVDFLNSLGIEYKEEEPVLYYDGIDWARFSINRQDAHLLSLGLDLEVRGGYRYVK